MVMGLDRPYQLYYKVRLHVPGKIFSYYKHIIATTAFVVKCNLQIFQIHVYSQWGDNHGEQQYTAYFHTNGQRPIWKNQGRRRTRKKKYHRADRVYVTTILRNEKTPSKIDDRKMSGENGKLWA